MPTPAPLAHYEAAFYQRGSAGRVAPLPLKSAERVARRGQAAVLQRAVQAAEKKPP